MLVSSDALIQGFVVTCLALICANAQDPLRITQSPQDAKVVHEGVVSFFCKATGNPAPTIYWQKNGRRISNSSRYLIIEMPHGSVLRIEPVKTRRDDAEFGCVAENTIGDMVIRSASLQVYPHEQKPSGYPNILKNPTLKAVEKDFDTVMMCAADGNPQPSIMWLKDFIPVDFTHARFNLLEKGSLEILHTQETDEGKYECVAENSAGIVYSYGANLYVRVRRFPPFFLVHPESVAVTEGSDVNLTCEAGGSPMPTVTWRHSKSSEMAPVGGVFLGKNILELNNIQTSTNYTCAATSALGVATTTVEVRVIPLPPAPKDLVVSEVTAFSMKLSWNSSNENPTEKYQIMYRETLQPGSEYSVISDIYETEITVFDLKAYTVHEFRVGAVNQAGVTWSTVIAITEENIPYGAPENISVVSLSQTTVELRWQPPDENLRNGIITHYAIKYGKNTMQPWDNMILTTEQNLVITNLEIDTGYLFMIKAFTSKGAGPWSRFLHVHTDTRDDEAEHVSQVTDNPSSALVTHLTSIETSTFPEKPLPDYETCQCQDLRSDIMEILNKYHQKIEILENATLELRKEIKLFNNNKTVESVPNHNRGQFSAFGCVGENISISCASANVIAITRAYFGEYLSTCGASCCSPYQYDCTENVSINDAREWRALRMACDGKSDCIYNVKSTAFREECTVNKILDYMNVYYNCQPGVID